MPANPATNPGRHADCVVLCPAGVEPDAELLAALDRRELTVLRVRPTEPGSASGGEFAAMASVCQLMKSTVAAVRAGRESRGVILLIVEPRLIDKAPDLVHAVERYAPHAALWSYQSASSPRMRPVTPLDVSSWLDQESHEHPVIPLLPQHAAPNARPIESKPIRTTSTRPPSSSAPRPQSSSRHPTLPDYPESPMADAPRQFGQTRKDREPLSQAELAMLLADEPSFEDNGPSEHGSHSCGDGGAGRSGHSGAHRGLGGV